MNTLHILTSSPVLAAIVVALIVASIGVLIWAAMPERSADKDIERQIATLRRHADHAVTHRPRVRGNGCASQTGHIKAAPQAVKPKACGGGMCHHRADCSDVHFPGRLAATLSTTNQS
jgi:hypothetical protein